jgi:hypothetical protein
VSADKSEYYDEFKEVMKQQYIDNGENCKKYEFPYKLENFEEEYAFFLEWNENKMQELKAEEGEEGEEGEDGEQGEEGEEGEDGEQGEEGEEGEDGPDEPDESDGQEKEEEEEEEEDYQSKRLREIIEQDDDELSENFNDDTLEIPNLKESFLKHIKENGIDEENQIQENGLCDSAGCELFREYCKENM